ncbi:MAG: endonuclease/exonuclease/phosphatase family protein [Candidatus Paceibacterota bacterium]
MKIYSWNMLWSNRKLDRAFEFISKSDFDIFCLQEVPEEFLARLQTIQCHISYRTEVFRLFSSGTIQNFVVILSKHPILAEGDIPFPEYWHMLPLRTRLFVRLMRPFGFSKIRNRGAVFADISIPNMQNAIRIYNLHLILAQPAWRLREFEQAMAECDPKRPTIICGDFNILEKPHITPLNWVLGGRVTDALHWSRERTTIEKRFVEHELSNPLRGKVTHPFSHSQLDHILVSHSFSIKNAEVIPSRLGSDHHPILVEVT